MAEDQSLPLQQKLVQEGSVVQKLGFFQENAQDNFQLPATNFQSAQGVHPVQQKVSRGGNAQQGLQLLDHETHREVQGKRYQSYQ